MPQALLDDGVSEQQFYNNMQKYADELGDFELDMEAFVADLTDKMITPLQEANEMFKAFRYMTRMYTIISPNEMSRDPIFLTNPDLPTVSNVHRAVSKPYCEGDTNKLEKVVITLEDGSQLTYGGPFNDWETPPELLEDAEAIGGAASAVQRMFTGGLPEDISATDIPTIDQEFDGITIGLVASGAMGGIEGGNRPADPGTASSDSSSGGCSAASPSSFFGLGLLMLLGLMALFVARRRQV